MLRQLYVFHEGKKVFSHNLALALDDEQFQNVVKLIESYLEMPMPGKTFQRPISNFQIFHQGFGKSYFLFVTDTVDSFDYIEKALKKTIEKFKQLFPEPGRIAEPSPERENFIDYLYQVQADLHSKIAIAGPTGSGRTTLWNLLRSGQEERKIMNFALTAPFKIGKLSFDIWDFQLDDNFSLLWSKFIGGSDLIIILFDASNYNLKIINHFQTMLKKEGRFSKHVILANKMDLVNEDAIRRINSEIEEYEVSAISLKDTEGKATVAEKIREALNLKKPLPPNFNQLIEKAKALEEAKNIINAIAKYKELINICKVYQEFTYLDKFQQKLEELQEKREEQIKLKKEMERKKKFSRPEKIKFKSNIAVKSLPSVKSLPKKKQEPQSNTRPMTTDIKGKKDHKLTLGPEDVKINLKFPKSPKKKAKAKKQDVQKIDKKEIERLVKEGNYARVLQLLIKSKGSSLNLKLCQEYVKELQNAFSGEELSLPILERSAESFIKTERG